MEKNLENQNPHAEKLLGTLFFTLIISVMNATMFNVVLPTISHEFNLTAAQVSWISTGYMIIYAIGSVTYGKLADQFRLKDLLTFGLLFMGVGSILGFIATEYWMIILGRVLQAMGASVIPATAMIIPVRYFSPEKRGRALGTMASGLAFGSAIGPIIAGFVTSFLGWRFLFSLSLLTLLTLPFYRKYLDDNRGQAGKMDFLGGLLLGGTVALALLALTRGELFTFLLALVLCVLFILRIRSAEQPFIQPALFVNQAYTRGILVTVVGTSVAFGIPFIVPQMLAKVNHTSPALIGLIMFPGAIASALLGRTGGKLADTKGNSYLFYLAILSLIFAFGSLSILAGMSPYVILAVLVFGNVGQTFFQIAMSNKVSQTLSREQAGVGMGLFQMLNFIAGATATTLIGKVLDMGPAAYQLNPFLISNQGVVYSNIFVVMAGVTLINCFLFYKLLGTVPATKLGET